MFSWSNSLVTYAQMALDRIGHLGSCKPKTVPGSKFKDDKEAPDMILPIKSGKGKVVKGEDEEQKQAREGLHR